MKTLIHFQDNNVIVDDDDGEMLNMKICTSKEGWMKIDFGGEAVTMPTYNDVGAKKWCFQNRNWMKNILPLEI